jgi:DNA-directed RNA polymerase specialized sigma24 family protein
MLVDFRILLRDLRAPERLRTNPVLRRLFSREITSHDLRALCDGIELNLARLPERERIVLLQHDIEHVPANDVRRNLYISARQFSIERRRGLSRLYNYVIGDATPAVDGSKPAAGPREAQPRAIRDKDIVAVLRPKADARTNPLVDLVERLPDDVIASYVSATSPPSAPLARARAVVRAMLGRLPSRERQIVLASMRGRSLGEIALTANLSLRHTGRVRANALRALREGLAQLESRSQRPVEPSPLAEGPAPLAIPLARALMQAGAYGGALSALDDAIRVTVNNTDRLMLNLEAADIELQAQLRAGASGRIAIARRLLVMGDVPVASAATCELWTATLEALLAPNYFVALELCERALRSYRAWLLEHRATKESAVRVIWALCSIAEVARTAGLPSRARSAVIEAEQLVTQFSLEHACVATHLRLQRACADIALFGSLGDALESLADQFEQNVDRGWFASAIRAALCIVDHTSSVGRHDDAVRCAQWIAGHVDRLSPLDRVTLALTSADALTRSGRAAAALGMLAPLKRSAESSGNGAPRAAVEIRVAEALVSLGRPRAALAEALAALDSLNKKKAFPSAARAHAAAAQCYGALDDWQNAMLQVEQSQSLAERFASPAQLLQVYAACANVADDRHVRGSVAELRRLIETSAGSGRSGRARLPRLFAARPRRVAH